MRLKMVLAVAVFSSVVAGGGQFNLEPTGSKGEAITIVQKDGGHISVPAQKAAWRLDGGMTRNYSRMAVPAKGLPIVSAPVSIETPWPSRELPGGTLYVVQLEKDRNGFSFRADAEGQNEPQRKYVAAKTSDLKGVEKNGGMAYTIDPSKILKPGQYAVVMLNNQYLWPFEIR